MIEQELSRLLSASAAMEKPKVERAAKADTKKNRLALIDACERANLEQLRRLLDIGAPVNILNERGYSNSNTPLAICAKHGWCEGIQALLDAGASERDTPEFLTNAQGEPYPEKARKITCLEVAAQSAKHEAFALLFEHHSDEERARAVEMIREPAVYLEAERLGWAPKIAKPRLVEIMRACLHGLDPAALSSAGGAAKSQAFDSISLLLGAKTDRELANGLWMTALSEQRPGVLQGLASRGVMPSPDGSIELVPSKSTHTYNSMAHWTETKDAPTRYNPDNKSVSFIDVAHQPIRVGLATAAILLTHPSSEPRSAYALCAVPALREELAASAIGRHYVALNADPKLLKRLADAGCSMQDFATDLGSNPLHIAAKRDEPKTVLESLARICTEWISLRDNAGKIPLEYCKGDKKTSLTLLFDQIGMRDAMKGRLGSRHTPAKTKRL